MGLDPTPLAHSTLAEDVAGALTWHQGHLFVGMNGYVLTIGLHHTLTGYHPDEVFGEALAQGLPLIDARRVPEPVQIDLSFAAPRGETLQARAMRYAGAGARLANLPDIHGSFGGARDYIRRAEARAGDYAGVVAKARATRGGHLWIGPYGSALYYGDITHTGFDPEAVKIAALAGGLPVIDTRGLDPAEASRLVRTVPQIAVNRDADDGERHCLSYAPLALVAAAYRAAGAEVFNVALPEEA